MLIRLVVLNSVAMVKLTFSILELLELVVVVIVSSFAIIVVQGPISHFGIKL